MRPSPPNFFMSLQNGHSPHSVLVQASHLRHRTLRRRMLLDTVNPPDEVTLADVAGEMSTDFDSNGESEAVLGGNSSISSLPLACSTKFSATALSS